MELDFGEEIGTKIQRGFPVAPPSKGYLIPSAMQRARNFYFLKNINLDLNFSLKDLGAIHSEF